METKPPTRTLPKVVMKEWPGKDPEAMWEAWPNPDFTRVVEETGILDQKETQRRKRASDHD